MKVKNGKINSNNNSETVDLNLPELQEDFRKSLLFGVPGKDKQGHHENVNFRVTALLMDLGRAIWDTSAPNTWANKSRMYRGIFYLGCKVALILLRAENEPKLLRYQKALNQLNEITKENRLREVEAEIQRQSAKAHGTYGEGIFKTIDNEFQKTFRNDDNVTSTH